MQELEEENKSIPPVILLAAEELGKEIACAELPVVQKYLNNAKTNLEASGLHPIKLAVINWLLKEIPVAESMLGCPVPEAKA